MCHDPSCLGYLLISILVGFACLIFVSLRYRKKFLALNLQLTADQVWDCVAERAQQENFEKSNLLFGVWQDDGSVKRKLVVKDFKSEVVGVVEFPMGSRELKVWVGKEEYRIDILYTGLKSAILRKIDDESPLVRYSTLNIFGKHKFDIPDYGTLASERPVLSLRIIFNYRIGNKLVGTTQEISPRRQVGRLAILPSNIPLHIRIFFLAF